MASSKTIVLFGLLFAIVLLISSEVSARELAQDTQSQESVEEANYGHGYGPGYGHGGGGSYGHGGGGRGGGGRGGGGHGGHGGHPPEETEDVKN
ncbi:cold and drought-regulated protein CORA-like [Syzygium oleosum]|uniref:cold and drought-regulated protein CORA-like n=1 Tax=Syzygium oleosum TaxID=219896 RepID=UPI0024BB596C|nr:cold and drought-regulated protein CORA-like [Syzygium oleosum]